MSFKFKINQTVSQGIKKLAKWQIEKALEKGALELGGLISDQADKGQGLRGGFKEYSARYKRKHGRPDLQDSGEMMRSVVNPNLKYRKSKGSFVVKISLPSRKHTGANIDIDELAIVQHARRPFFGVTRRYEKIVNKIVLKELGVQYAKLNLN